ncbi:MAG: hypothetical protein ACYCYI_08220 [Saccharofermentanales bacterium]
MIKILLLERDDFYCRRVCAQINSISKIYKCYNKLDYSKEFQLIDNSHIKGNHDLYREVIDLGSLEIDWPSTLVIYNSSQFYNPPENSNSIMLAENSLSEIPGIDENSFCQIYKYCSLTAMIDKIDDYLRNHPSLIPVPRMKSLICILGAACPSLRAGAIDKIVQEKLETGIKVVRLDFCPSYFSDFPVSESKGYTLSDAFLRLMADDLSYDDFGIFLVPRADSTLQFRPIERADDLFDCTPDHFRKFIVLLQKWVTETDNRYFIIINCYAIPFSSVYAIAVLCDQLILLNQDKIPARTKSYNKEMSYLLANLPNSCEVQEMLLACPE